jgi:hypothetical protein
VNPKLQIQSEIKVRRKETRWLVILDRFAGSAGVKA